MSLKTNNNNNSFVKRSEITSAAFQRRQEESPVHLTRLAQHTRKLEGLTDKRCLFPFN